MDDEAILTIIRYVNRKLPEPHISWPRSDFKKRSLERWAAYEIIGLLLDNPFVMPDFVIYDYMIKMSVLSYDNHNKKRREVFKIASKTAEEILKLFNY